MQILQQAWPFVGQYLEKLLVETIAPAIRASSIHLQTLSFTKVNLGDKVSEWLVIKAAIYSVNVPQPRNTGPRVLMWVICMYIRLRKGRYSEHVCHVIS